MSHLSPIPCAHCGTNFMRKTPDPEAPKLCNNCEVRANNQKPKGEIDMEKVKLLIEVDRAAHVQIEEICMNEGISLSKYFMNLHEINMNKDGWKCKMTPEMKKMHEEFEGMGHEEPELVEVPRKKSKGAKK